LLYISFNILRNIVINFVLH